MCSIICLCVLQGAPRPVWTWTGPNTSRSRLIQIWMIPGQFEVQKKSHSCLCNADILMSGLFVYLKENHLVLLFGFSGRYLSVGFVKISPLSTSFCDLFSLLKRPPTCATKSIPKGASRNMERTDTVAFTLDVGDFYVSQKRLLGVWKKKRIVLETSDFWTFFAGGRGLWCTTGTLQDSLLAIAFLCGHLHPRRAVRINSWTQPVDISHFCDTFGPQMGYRRDTCGVPLEGSRAHTTKQCTLGFSLPLPGVYQTLFCQARLIYKYISPSKSSECCFLLPHTSYNYPNINLATKRRIPSTHCV